MIPSLRKQFNSGFTPEKYQAFLRRIDDACGTHVSFRLAESPCFFPKSLLERMAEYGKELIRQLVESPEYRARSNASIPAEFLVPNETTHPMFVQVDFGLVRDSSGQLQPKLVELQAFPSLYAYQVTLAQRYIDVFGLNRFDGGERLQFFLSGLDEKSYRELLRRAIVGGHDSENVILLEIDPLEQKTLPDFLLTEKMLGIKTVSIAKVEKRGNRLYHDGVPIERIYNRVIVDELQRKQIQTPFDYRDDLQVEWAGHPNWYFRISKFSLPFLKHPSVPQTRFLSEGVPDDLENWVLKPLYSFAGLGVVIGPTRADVARVTNPDEYILQRRVDFASLIETPFGATKAEVRMMYIWLDQLRAVSTIVRMGR